MLGRPPAVLIIDPNGEIVWYHRDDRELDFYRARLSRRRQEPALQRRERLGRSGRRLRARARRARRLGDQLDPGAAARPRLRRAPGRHARGDRRSSTATSRASRLRGDKIVEVDPDGGEPTRCGARGTASIPPSGRATTSTHGWTFANALDYDPDEDAYYLGMRNFSSIAKIDRASGDVRVGARRERADLRVRAAARRASCTSTSSRCAAIASSCMDNDGQPRQRVARARVRARLRREGGDQVWSYVADPTVYTFVLGEPTRLDDGSTFVNWSSAGQLERVTRRGRVDLEAELDRRLRLRLPHAGAEPVSARRQDSLVSARAAASCAARAARRRLRGQRRARRRRVLLRHDAARARRGAPAPSPPGPTTSRP